MGNFEIVECDNSVDLYVDSSLNTEETSTDSAEYITRRSSNVLLKYIVSGSILLTTPSQGCFPESITISENVESLDHYLQTYNDCVDLPFNRYITNVNDINSTSKFSKKEVIRNIVSFKSLNNKWDGYGAIPLEVESATNALYLIELMNGAIYEKLKDFYPNPNGTISFLWGNESNESISLEIGNMMMSYYVEFNSKEIVFSNNIDINDKEASKLYNFIHNL